MRTTQPAPTGYANSKYIAEKLLDTASRECGIDASFARVGQIAGAVRLDELWNKYESFPSLVLSSYISALPDDIESTLGRIDWVPVDLLVGVLVDLALDQVPARGRYCWDSSSVESLAYSVGGYWVCCCWGGTWLVCRQGGGYGFSFALGATRASEC